MDDGAWMWSRDWADDLTSRIRRSPDGTLSSVNPTDFALRAEQAWLEAVKSATSITADEMRRTHAQAVRYQTRVRRRFERRNDWIWGTSIDSLAVVAYACTELANGHVRAHGSQRETEDDFTCNALCKLLARSLVTTSDIVALLRSGHGLGATARWRTLHEICVVSAVIAEASAEVAERFHWHAAIHEHRDVVAEEAARASRGRQPAYSPEEVAELAQARDEVVRRFGKEMRDEYGWAAPLFPPTRAGQAKVVRFRDLETLAERSHFRPDYLAACHLVHSGAVGADLVQVHAHGSDLLLSGPSNNWIAEPGVATVHAIFQCMMTVLMHDDRDTHPLLSSAVAAVRELVRECEHEFEAASKHLTDRIDAYEGLRVNEGRLGTWAYLFRSSCFVAAHSCQRALQVATSASWDRIRN